DLANEHADVLAELDRTSLPELARPLAVVAATLGQVLGHRVTLAAATPNVRRNPHVVEVDGDDRAGGANHHLPPDEAPEHRVEGTVEDDVAVPVHLRVLPKDGLEPLCGQRN